VSVHQGSVPSHYLPFLTEDWSLHDCVRPSAIQASIGRLSFPEKCEIQAVRCLQQSQVQEEIRLAIESA